MDQQVETICKAGSWARTIPEVDQVLMLYILDERFTREAICAARKALLKQVRKEW
jgi:hypothetical protein